MQRLAKKLLAMVLTQLIAFVLVIADGDCQTTEQSINTDPGHKEQLSIGGISLKGAEARSRGLMDLNG